MQSTRVAICVYTTNASQTLLSVEIAKAIVKNHRQKQQKSHNQETDKYEPVTQSSLDYTLRFFTYRGCRPGNPPRTIDYEHLITDAGFDVQYFGSVDNNNLNRIEEKREDYSLAIVDDDMWLAFLDAERKHLGFFPPPYDKRASPYIHAIMKTLGDFQPDVVVFGLFPEVAVASAIQGWRTVSYVSLPPCTFRAWVQNQQRLKTTNRSATENDAASENKPTDPWMVIQDAAAACGLELPTPTSIHGQDRNAEFFKAIQPNHTIVCDLESYYENEKLPSDITVVGPIVSSGTHEDTKVLREIESFLQQRSLPLRRNQNVYAPVKVLLTMGSTGDLTSFLEGFKSLCLADAGTFLSVVMIPSTVSLSTDIFQSADTRDAILLVKKFVDARLIMPLVDVVLCHGGQQTIHTALAAGVPIVGRPAHYEQQYNLDHVERCQAGVCIAPDDWKQENIRKVLLQVGKESLLYRDGAARLQAQFLNCRGAERAASIIMDVLYSEQLKKY